jgi:hypothetical protein
VKSEGIICASGGDYIRANYLHFTSSGFGMSNELRFSGMSVRPVME